MKNSLRIGSLLGVAAWLGACSGGTNPWFEPVSEARHHHRSGLPELFVLAAGGGSLVDVAVVKSLKGQVNITTVDGVRRPDIGEGAQLDNEDTVTTGAGASCVIAFVDGSTFGLSGNTTVKIDQRKLSEPVEEKDLGRRLELTAGHVDFKVEHNEHVLTSIASPTGLVEIFGSDGTVDLDAATNSLSHNLRTGRSRIRNPNVQISFDIAPGQTVTLTLDLLTGEVAVGVTDTSPTPRGVTGRIGGEAVEIDRETRIAAKRDTDAADDAKEKAKDAKKAADEAKKDLEEAEKVKADKDKADKEKDDADKKTDDAKKEKADADKKAVEAEKKAADAKTDADKKAAEAEKKAADNAKTDADKKAAEAEKKAAEAGKKAADAEKKEAEAKSKAADSDKKASDADKKADDAGKKADDAAAGDKNRSPAEKKAEADQREAEKAQREADKADRGARKGGMKMASASSSADRAEKEAEKETDPDKKARKNEDAKAKRSDYEKAKGDHDAAEKDHVKKSHDADGKKADAVKTEKDLPKGPKGGGDVEVKILNGKVLVRNPATGQFEEKSGTFKCKSDEGAHGDAFNRKGGQWGRGEESALLKGKTLMLTDEELRLLLAGELSYDEILQLLRTEATANAAITLDLILSFLDGLGQDWLEEYGDTANPSSLINQNSSIYANARDHFFASLEEAKNQARTSYQGNPIDLHAFIHVVTELEHLRFHMDDDIDRVFFPSSFATDHSFEHSDLDRIHNALHLSEHDFLHAVMDVFHDQFHRDHPSIPPGSPEETEHNQLHADLDRLHTALHDAGTHGVIHAILDTIHNDWHSNNPSASEAEHAEFHRIHDQIHDEAHTIFNIPK